MPTKTKPRRPSPSPPPGIDETILKLNKELETAIGEYVSKGVTIRFDLPDEDHTSKPTVSIFLYDIQENLELRSGFTPVFDPPVDENAASGEHPMTLTATNVTCRYLFTYWEQKTSVEPIEQYAGPTNQAITAMNQILNAILAHRHFTSVEVAQCRVIPPMDLQSLGIFWQSLQSKPRLCLGYELTLSVKAQIAQENHTVSNIEIKQKRH